MFFAHGLQCLGRDVAITCVRQEAISLGSMLCSLGTKGSTGFLVSVFHDRKGDDLKLIKLL